MKSYIVNVDNRDKYDGCVITAKLIKINLCFKILQDTPVAPREDAGHHKPHNDEQLSRVDEGSSLYPFHGNCLTDSDHHKCYHNIYKWTHLKNWNM